MIQIGHLCERISVRRTNEQADHLEFQAALHNKKIKMPRLKVKSAETEDVDGTSVETYAALAQEALKRKA